MHFKDVCSEVLTGFDAFYLYSDAARNPEFAPGFPEGPLKPLTNALDALRESVESGSSRISCLEHEIDEMRVTLAAKADAAAAGVCGAGGGRAACTPSLQDNLPLLVHPR